MISIVIEMRMGKETETATVIVIRLETIRDVIVIIGNHFMDDVIVLLIQMTPSSYHQAFSDEAAF